MIFNLSATEFHLATRVNGEKIIEVLNDTVSHLESSRLLRISVTTPRL